jgi:Flp pilus assembly protein TadD
MQEATDEAVLGDFHDVSFEHYGVRSTFFRRDGKFMVKTDGPDGKLQEYPIAYTFGVDPIQQYLIAFPGGRYQALNVVWDARPKGRGGQRWFHLYPKEAVPHGDPLHWTGPYQNWNFMCADCHSTNVKKGYSSATNSYATTFSEIDVSCEACHGPGSAHVDWAAAVRAGRAKTDDPDKGLAVVLKDHDGATWDFDLKTGIAKRSLPRTSQAQIETCARCHARRSVVAADYVFGEPLMQTYRPALLDAGVYFADGQFLEEDYEYGSFLQSKMYAAGVTCSNCHNPHDLKIPVSANQACATCHMPEKFATPEHHFHPAASTGASCIGCHMPTRDYMVIDARHDHSMRVPRPDLSISIGTPNACTQCHRGKSDQWAAQTARKWWGKKPAPGPADVDDYGEVIHAAQQQRPGAAAGLARWIGDPAKPAIRRATAASLLGGSGTADSAALARALSDPSPLVRDGALDAAEVLEPVERLRLVGPLLRDPIRTVRIDAARTLVRVPKEQMTAAQRSDFERALSEYVESQLVDADRAEAHINLAGVYAAQGEAGKAEAEYRTAIRLTPALGAAYVNLADLYRQQGREGEAEAVLREGLAAAPADPGVHYALGLSLVRQKRMPEALEELRKAAEAPPPSPRYAYVYGVALDSVGETGRAIQVLAAAHARHAGNAEILQALVAFSEKTGDPAAAQAYARKLEALGTPQSP